MEHLLRHHPTHLPHGAGSSCHKDFESEEAPLSHPAHTGASRRARLPAPVQPTMNTAAVLPPPARLRAPEIRPHATAPKYRVSTNHAGYCPKLRDWFAIVPIAVSSEGHLKPPVSGSAIASRLPPSLLGALRSACLSVAYRPGTMAVTGIIPHARRPYVG